jgi:hypothetical protein
MMTSELYTLKEKLQKNEPSFKVLQRYPSNYQQEWRSHPHNEVSNVIDMNKTNIFEIMLEQ